MKQTLLYLLFVTVLFSCSKNKDDFKPDDHKVPANEARTLLDVAYGSDDLQKMDIYLPANRSTTSTKVIILIHGGAWADGDKYDEDFKPLVDSVKRRLPDWAIFNLNYRLVTIMGKNRFPTQEEDIAAAVKYIFGKRQDYVISDKWVMAGASAGAHLALVQAYKNNQLIKPKAVVDFYGPTDLKALYNFYISSGDAATAAGMNILLKGTPTSNPSLYESSSPINFVSAQSPPTIILQGGLDDVVPKEQSLALEDKLNAAGVPNQFIYYEGQTHGWSDPVVVNDSFNKIQAFLSIYVP